MEVNTIAILMVVCLLSGTAIGAWRQMCGILAIKQEWDAPLAWRNILVRSITWVLSTSLSIVGAFYASVLLAPLFGEFGAKFSLGVILLFRWWASMFIAWKMLRIKYTNDELI